MTCKEQEKVLHEDLDPGHLEACADCRESAQILAHSRDLLRSNRATLPAHIRVDIRAQLDQQRQTSARGLLPRFLVPAMAACGIALLTFVGLKALDQRAPTATPGPMVVRTQRMLPMHKPLSLDERGEIRFGKGSIHLARSSAVRFAQRSLSWSELTLSSGSANLEVRPLKAGERFVVHTPAGELEVLGTRFSVEVLAARTSVAVEHGQVRVSPKSAQESFVLHEGQSAELEHPKIAVVEDPISRRLRKVAERAAKAKKIEVPSKASAATRSARPRQARKRPRATTAPKRASRQGAPQSAPRRLTENTLERPNPARSTGATPGTKLDPAAHRAIAELTPPIPAAQPEKALSSSPHTQAPPAKPPAAKKAEPAPPSVEEPKAPPLTPSELMVRADALRRDGELREAAALYGRIAQQSGIFAEEAMFQQARLLLKKGEHKRAQAVLQSAAQRFPNGALSGERAALNARLLLDQGELQKAASLLLSQKRASLELQSLRLKTAEALVNKDPTRARALLAMVLGSKVPHTLLEQARALDKKAQARLQKK